MSGRRIILTGTSGAGKSSVLDVLRDYLDPERYACIGADETGLNWWDYAGTDHESDYNEDCLKIALERAEGRDLVFATCMNPLDYRKRREGKEDGTAFIVLCPKDEIIESRLKARPKERRFDSDEAIRPHLEYNRWICNHLDLYDLSIDNSSQTVDETVNIILSALGESGHTGDALHRICRAIYSDTERIRVLYREEMRSIFPGRQAEDPAPHAYDKYFTDTDDRLWVAKQDGIIIGFLALEIYRDPDYAYLDDVCVTEQYRNLGIGTELILIAEEYAKSLGIPAVVLHAEETNDGALRLYKRLGFHEYGITGNRIRLIRETEKDH